MNNIPPAKSIDAGFAADCHTIHGPFVAYLRAKGLTAATAYTAELYLVRTARWLRDRGRRLSSLDHRDIAPMCRYVRRGSIHGVRPALRHWLRFQNKPITRPATAPWSDCLDRYRRFATEDQGLAASSCRHNTDEARRFLAWQFGDEPACWAHIHAKDVWRYAEHRARGLGAGSAQTSLRSLAAFLRWIYLCGECAEPLMEMVPKVANFQRVSNPTALSETQRRQLLRSFDLTTAQGRCEHAMALAMLDLGLRVSEVVSLALSDIDWVERSLRVPPVKGGHGRVVPITSEVEATLRAYIDTTRPPGLSDRVFLRQRRLVGRPVSVPLVSMAMRRAYRRCGFPPHWSGTHILRRTFATRLHRHGADMRQIGDLLGHRQLKTTGLYTSVALNDLRQLAQPWLVQS